MLLSLAPIRQAIVNHFRIVVFQKIYDLWTIASVPIVSANALPQDAINQLQQQIQSDVAGLYFHLYTLLFFWIDCSISFICVVRAVRRKELERTVATVQYKLQNIIFRICVCFVNTDSLFEQRRLIRESKKTGMPGDLI